MKYKKFFIFLPIIFLLFSSSVYASANNSFLSYSQSWFAKQCYKYDSSKNKADSPIICYLFDKVNEHDNQIQNFKKGTSIMKIFDSNGKEIGIFMSYDTFFNLKTNKIASIDLSTGRIKSGWGLNAPDAVGGIYYTSPNCQGTAYLWPTSSFETSRVNSLYAEWNGKYYIVDESIPLSSSDLIFVSSYVGENICDNGSVNQAKAYTLKEVNPEIPSPIKLPLRYKFE